MPPKKGGNEKKESGRAKKAENEAKKKEDAAAAAERKVAAAWEDGAKQKKQKDLDRDAKKAADADRKAAAARQLADEEASTSSSKPKGTGQKGAAAKQKGKAKDSIPAGPGAIAAGGLMAPSTDPSKELDAPNDEKAQDEPKKVEEFAATGLDDALEMMSLVTAKTDKASVGQVAAGIESHPERRFKAAFEAYKERTVPELKEERPGLRLQQYNDILYKQFQKHPDNPFNQQTVAYNATQEEKMGVLQRQKERTENRYRQQP
ncbi:hypothetical protein FRB90_001610 [Tulasnella sp. 427]|nr:hypothetical protein FRB90_001610 [Tulasnella sp. 427]